MIRAFVATGNDEHLGTVVAWVRLSDNPVFHAGFSSTGEVYLHGRTASHPSTVTFAAIFEGVPFVVVDGNNYFPASWLGAAFPTSAEARAEIAGNVVSIVADMGGRS